MGGPRIDDESISDENAGESNNTGGKYGRRALMLGAAAGVGAAAVVAAKPQSASATEGNPVLAGQSNTATSTTEVSTSSGTGMKGISVDPSGIADYTAGVVGDSNTNPGVVGLATVSPGVIGQSTDNPGVLGTTGSTSPAVQGLAYG
jgi:hypothetical protein